jgi:hypothetical protein
MPSADLIRVAANTRTLVSKGRYHGKASELVKTFGVEFTADGLAQVEDALAAQGLASVPKLSLDKPKAHVVVKIIGGSSSSVGVQIDEIEIFAGDPGRPYETLGPLRARVTAATIFSKTPTVEDVNLKLREEAVRLGANAVINVTYSRGVSATSWKAMTADGTGVLAEAKPPAAVTDSSSTDPVERIRQLSELQASGAITQEEFAAAKQRLLESI